MCEKLKQQVKIGNITYHSNCWSLAQWSPLGYVGALRVPAGVQPQSVSDREANHRGFGRGVVLTEHPKPVA